MIILTALERGQVLGISPTHSYAAIDPIPIKDGTFMLSEEAISDCCHADVKSFLETLPTREVDGSEFYVEGDEAIVEGLDLDNWKEIGVR